MTEPDVALTDYGLVVECVIFIWLIGRCADSRLGLRGWMASLFGSTAAAALFGGTLHGFFSVQTSVTGQLLWKLSLLAIGVTAFSGWMIGGRLVLQRHTPWLTVAASLQFAIYAAVVLFVHDSFWVAIVDYLPAALFLMVAFGLAACRPGAAGARRGSWGLALSFVAAGIQHFRIALHPTYFNHNALYHFVQAVALVLIFFGCRAVLQAGVGNDRYEKRQ